MGKMGEGVSLYHEDAYEGTNQSTIKVVQLITFCLPLELSYAFEIGIGLYHGTP